MVSVEYKPFNMGHKHRLGKTCLLKMLGLRLIIETFTKQVETRQHAAVTDGSPSEQKTDRLFISHFYSFPLKMWREHVTEIVYACIKRQFQFTFYFSDLWLTTPHRWKHFHISWAHFKSFRWLFSPLVSITNSLTTMIKS